MSAADAGIDAGMAPEEALDVLIRNTLLAGEAKRQGFGAADEVEDTRRLALARHLLEVQVGEGIRADTIDENKLKKTYDALKGRYVHGVKRRVVHFLAQTRHNMFDDEEAHQVAKDARNLTLGAKSEAAFKERLHPLESRYKNKVKIESLSPFDAETTSLVRPFVEATFVVPKVLGVSEPVKTRFGWHVIFVAEELQSSNRSFEEVRGALAEEVLPLAKKAAVTELIDGLAEKAGVFVYEEELEQKSRTP